MYHITALVPMKGQSERVVGKNMRSFCGQPLCMRILATLQTCSCISDIIVNTDSDELASIAEQFGKVRVHERPRELRGHHIPMNTILEWDLTHDSGCSKHYLQTHATNPLLTTSTIERAVNVYFKGLDKYDSLFSVTPFQTRLYSADGKGINHNPSVLLNTQNLPMLYEENSNIYLFSRDSFARTESRVGLQPYLFVMSKLESLDIDTEEDFLIAEAAWSALYGHNAR